MATVFDFYVTLEAVVNSEELKLILKEFPGSWINEITVAEVDSLPGANPANSRTKPIGSDVRKSGKGFDVT